MSNIRLSTVVFTEKLWKDKKKISFRWFGLVKSLERVLSHEIYFFKFETPLSGIRTHNPLICGQTHKPFCPGARQEDSCSPKVLI